MTPPAHKAYAIRFSVAANVAFDSRLPKGDYCTLSMKVSEAQRLGRYRLVDQLGEGGMAVVHKAIVDGPRGVSSPFVIKRILPSLSQDSKFVDMLVNEARLSALLRHPCIVQLHELGEEQGEYFLVMEYVAGRDLAAVLSAAAHVSRPMPVGVAAFIVGELLSGLAYAHALKDERGRPLEIVHRDVSPSNVLLTGAGAVKLLDFGIAKAAAHVNQERTRTGVLKGKVSYLSPEQADGLPIDHRSDIFSLGILFHEALTMKRLFRADDDLQTLRMVREANVRPPSSVRSEIPAALDNVVMRMLARDPRVRFQNCDDALRALRPVLHDLRGDAQGLAGYLSAVETPVRRGNDGEPTVGLTKTPSGGVHRTPSAGRPLTPTARPNTPATPTISRLTPPSPSARASTTTSMPRSSSRPESDDGHDGMMQKGLPSVRASLPKSAWAEIARLHPATIAKVSEALGHPWLGMLEKTTGIAWVPFELEARIADAAYKVLGADETRALYRRKTHRSFEIPIIRPIFQSALRLFGGTPASLVRMMGKSWTLLARDCGSYECESVGERRCESIVRGFPCRFYQQEEAWRASAFGGYEGFFVPVGVQGRVALVSSNFQRGEARFVLEW
jgi:serine/threonine protein kinase